MKGTFSLHISATEVTDLAIMRIKSCMLENVHSLYCLCIQYMCVIYHLLLLSHCISPQVRDDVTSKQPSEVQISLEEVQNPCRLVLRPPDPRGPSERPSSRAQHEPKGLLILAIVLLLSSLIMIE